MSAGVVRGFACSSVAGFLSPPRLNTSRGAPPASADSWPPVLLLIEARAALNSEEGLEALLATRVQKE
eukprot:1529777-Pleurochrysis_carterae.AAC.1